MGPDVGLREGSGAIAPEPSAAALWIAEVATEIGEEVRESVKEGVKRFVDRLLRGA